MKLFNAFHLLFLIITSISCSMMVKIKASEQRNPTPQTFGLTENIEITTWGSIQINKSHFFPSSFQIKSGETIIYIDPLEIESNEKADYVFITHAHPDHFSLSTIERIVNEQTQFICPQEVAKKLTRKGYQVIEVKPGGTGQLNGISFEAIPAYNTRTVFLWIKAHPKSKLNVGYILYLDNDKSIYHAGDTDYIPEMDQIKNIDLAILPIGGDNLTMDVNEALIMVDKLKPKYVIPMHYELKNKDDLKDFQSSVGSETIVKILE